VEGAHYKARFSVLPKKSPVKLVRKNCTLE